MFDKIEKLGNSLIQHGKSNNRIYLLKPNVDDVSILISELDSLANKNGYTKIFVKISTGLLPAFVLNNYVVEAFIPKFYKGETDCVLASKFLDEERYVKPDVLLTDLTRLLNLKRHFSRKGLPSGLHISMLSEDDVEAAAEVFKVVFDSYPFPVYDPAYLLQTMRSNMALYFGVWAGNRLVGISTSETDFDNRNAEMTDFAVLHEYRGNGLALHLLLYMEKAVKEKGIKTVYTIARLTEPGMNLTFIKGGYKYSGTLINNTNIGGSIESMNVFYKHL